MTGKTINSFVKKRNILLILTYGVGMAGLIFLLKFIEYKYFIRDFTTEMYIGIVAILFTAVGVWVGSKLVKRKSAEKRAIDFEADEEQIKQLGISRREFEVLELIAKGLSNKEIGEKLFISIPTVKTHSSNLFVKLDVQRRTQAIQRARELKIIT